LKIPALGLDLWVRMHPSTSANALAWLETRNAPGFGPPLHRHRETEVFRVSEGCYLFQVGDRQFEAGEGDVISVPEGRAHTFVSVTAKPARRLVLMLPGMDSEAFFLGRSEPFQTKPSLDQLNAYGKRWGVEFLGPPLSAPRG
jgi:mannose-6-phosphate isomerase-like protein (cupin superfamily)